MEGYLGNFKEKNFSDELIKFGIIFYNDEIKNITLNNLYNLYFNASNDPRFDEFSDFLMDYEYYPSDIMNKIISEDLPINNDPDREIKIKIVLLMKENNLNILELNNNISEEYYAEHGFEGEDDRNVILNRNLEYFDNV